MFSSVLVGTAFRFTDPDKERDPPPTSTPVTFPLKPDTTLSQWSAESPPPDYQHLFSKITRPTEIVQSHLDALNIDLLPECSIEKLVPLAEDGSSYLPPLSVEKDTLAATDASKVDRQALNKRKDFDDRLTELMASNDDAFRVLTKAQKGPSKPLRLAYMRKFWDSLENMSQYWDSSLDQYYDSDKPDIPDDDVVRQDSKRAKLDVISTTFGSSPTSTTVPRPLSAGEANNISEVQPNLDGGNVPESKGSGVTANADEVSESPRVPEDAPNHASPTTQMRPRYKGRRTSTGRDMPDQFRIDTVRGFIEGTVWPFQTTIAPSRRIPLVQINKLNLPVRQSGVVTRNPKDRNKARSGWAEGPVMGLQVRSELDFVDAEGNRSAQKARLDLMREIGGILQLAQERQRQGKTETKPGQGQWWTEKPRWGGGPGGEVGAADGGGDADEVITQAAPDALPPSKETRLRPDTNRFRKRKTPALLWKELRVGSGVWDPKMDYAAIGKDSCSDYDEVFMISSLNHHISILKLTVHTAYIEYLTTTRLLSPLPADEKWCKPTLQRSQWFDLFDLDQRVAAFQGLWGIMTYLTRETSGPEQKSTLDALMTGF